MKLIFFAVFAFILLFPSKIFAQKNENKPWFTNYFFASGISYQSASIKINNEPATYEDLLALKDSSILKIEVYDKKSASKLFGKEDGKKPLILVTKKSNKPFPYPVETTEDSAKYYVAGGDTIFTFIPHNAFSNPDTAAKNLQKFLEKNLNSSVVVDNGAPPGIYNVTANFIVNKDGSISGVGVLEDAGYGSREEVLRIMKKLSYSQPAMYHGQPVKSLLKQTITFTVSG